MISTFQIKSNFQGDLPKEFFPLISLFQLSMHVRTLHQITEKNTHVTEYYLWLYSLIQSICPGILTEEDSSDVGRKIWNFIQDLNPWVIKIISDCWHFLISRLIIFRCQFYGKRNVIFMIFLVYEQIFVLSFLVGFRSFQQLV